MLFPVVEYVVSTDKSEDITRRHPILCLVFVESVLIVGNLKEPEWVFEIVVILGSIVPKNPMYRLVSLCWPSMTAYLSSSNGRVIGGFSVLNRSL